MQQAEANVVSQKSLGGHLAKGNQSVQQARLQNLGPGLPGAWGPGLGAGAFRCLGPGPAERLGPWETAEAAAAEVGAWRETGTKPSNPSIWVDGSLGFSTTK